MSFVPHARAGELRCCTNTPAFPNLEMLILSPQRVEFVRWLLKQHRPESIGCAYLPSVFHGDQNCDLNVFRLCLREFFLHERGLVAAVSKEAGMRVLPHCVKRWAFRKVTEVLGGSQPLLDTARIKPCGRAAASALLFSAPQQCHPFFLGMALGTDSLSRNRHRF